MVASPTPSPAESPVVAVAVSGGRDSMALLHATLRAARVNGLRVCALHVHHGLHPDADAWLAHVRSACRRWARRGGALSFRFVRASGSPQAGDSVEAWARQVRYDALSDMAREEGATLVLLAHHQRDQAETWLLQALRGAGAPGLSAMPHVRARDGVVFARPWLEQPATAITAYVRRHRIAHIHDDSNDDARFARNRLRLRVMPALREAFDGADAALAASAAQAQDTQACLTALAGMDLESCASDAGLLTARWQGLAGARARNALRHWALQVLGRGAPESLIERLMRELPAVRAGRWPAPGGELRLYRGVLNFAPAALALEPVEPVTEHATITGPGTFHFPAWAGSLRARRVNGGGIALVRLADCALRERRGEDRFQIDARSPARTLKKQFQSVAIPAWQRLGPVLTCGDVLVFVPGLGVDARALAPAGTPQLALQWLPDAAASLD